jgi:HEAT repeat protein
MRRNRFWLLSLCWVIYGLWSSTLARVAVSQELADNVIHEIGNLKDQDSGIRASAARTLGELKDPRATAPLAAALKDNDGQVRAAAVYALGVLKDPESIDPLISALKDENPAVQG